MKKRLLLVFVTLMLLTTMPVLASNGTTVDYGNITLSGGYQTGHFDDIWDLNAGDMVISFTYDATGLVDNEETQWEDHAWAELGVRTAQPPYPDFNPSWSGEFCPEQVFDLFADQDISVGHVTIQRVGDYLYVTYNITAEGWVITKTHLAVADNPDDFPQTKNGNPKVGQFEYSLEHNPPVASYAYPPIDVSGLEMPLYIAAHAIVEKGYSIPLVSDTDTQTAGWFEIDGYTGGVVPAYALEPTNYIGVDSWVDSADISSPNSAWYDENLLADAIWISSANELEGSNLKDQWRLFKEDFDIPEWATNIEGSLQFTADNAVAAYLDSTEIDATTYVYEEATEPPRDPSVQHFKNLYGPSNFSPVTGLNSLFFVVRNYYGTGDNPTALLYRAEISYDRSETAWGDGEDFPGKNWATYIEYEPDCELVEGSGIWLSTDHDEWQDLNTFDPDPPGSPTLDLDDKLILQKVGGHGEGDYDLPETPPSPGANHRIWWDRDGVDPWQNDETANTGGFYEVEIRLHATSPTSGTAYMTIWELDQGFETDGDWSTIELTPAGMTFTGDMKHLQVFYGLYGYGATHSVSFNDITVEQLP